MPNVYYGLTEEQKALINDQLLSEKFDGGVGDWLIIDLRRQALNVKKIILEKTWSHPTLGFKLDIKKDEFDKIKIDNDPHFVYPGQKGVLVVGENLYKGLQEWYRVQKYTQKELGQMTNVVKSFEEFIQAYITGKANEVELVQYQKMLDEEAKSLVVEKPTA